MKYFKLKYADGRTEVVKAESDLSLIRERALYTMDHVNTRIFELNGEQGAIARANDEEDN